MNQTRRRSDRPVKAPTDDGEWRIIIRCYDTKTFSRDAAREIRSVTGCSRWRSYQITVGIVAGSDEVRLLAGLNEMLAQAGVDALLVAGFMARSEPDADNPVGFAAVPGIAKMLRGLVGF